MGEIEGLKTTSNCQIFWNLRKRFSSEKKSVFLFTKKRNWYYIYLFVCENVYLLFFGSHNLQYFIQGLKLRNEIDA